MQRQTRLNSTRLGSEGPHFHRFRIGILEAAIVSDGPLTLPKPAGIFPDLPPDALAGALDAAGLPQDVLRVEQNALLVDLGGHLVLFDTGMGSSTRFGTEAGRLAANLAAAGIDPGVIDTIVFTHAHPDHCWGTIADDGTPVFPRAQIFISASEWHYWANRPPADASLSAAGFKRQLWPLRDRVQLLADGEEFLPGLHVLATPGHSPGHTSFIVTSAGEAACVMGDVAFHHLISFQFPGTRSAFDMDAAMGAGTRRRLLEGLARERMPVIGYHPPWPGLGHVEAAGDAFRWIA
jgi:glyoxylase-like metal-dependent hydrolase (beta-lactamase superfamily II)